MYGFSYHYSLIETCNGDVDTLEPLMKFRHSPEKPLFISVIMIPIIEIHWQNAKTCRGEGTTRKNHCLICLTQVSQNLLFSVSVNNMLNSVRSNY